MKNSADLRGCYPLRLKADVDNTLRDLQNFSFIIYSIYFPDCKGVLSFCSLFFCSPKITQNRPQVVSVNSSITCSGLH